jgi:ATP-dependent DNA helicase RecG
VKNRFVLFSLQRTQRRIGEFLKELDLTEGRFTGIPKMREAMRRNCSSPPTFATEEERTFFGVELRIQPAFAQAHDETRLTLNETEQRILRALQHEPKAYR